MPTQTTTNQLTLIANTIRGLALDAVDACNSGHPGLPLGCAEIFTVLYTQFLNHNPKNPQWVNRDRFILSAGHGSMALYASLHLAGFELPISELKAFRQLESRTPGHPELHETPGVETTTGPLGQGIATAVGMALGAKHIAARTGAPLDHHVVVLAGDGCLMEGISSEASSLAGHLQLDNLILLYDSNDICLDGPTSECFTEDVAARYRAYGWHVIQIDGHHFGEIETALNDARQRKGCPSLIICKTIIGKGSPSYAGTSEAHGKPFGKDETAATKMGLSIPTDPLFFVPDDISSLMATRLEAQAKNETTWNQHFDQWRKTHPQNAATWDALAANILSPDALFAIRSAEVKPGIATRAVSHALLQVILTHCPSVVGGSADLSCSDSTLMTAGGILTPTHYEGRNIKYGVREFAMAAAASGLAIQGMIKPFCGTFFTFSDYMKNAIRLAALMNLPVVYQFTHDSILLGEDGPTHQPIEHLAALRAMPNLTVIRPADIAETKAAWIVALTRKNPVALILTRQGVKEGLNTDIDRAQKGGYIVQSEGPGEIDYTFIATGSELNLAIESAAKLTEQGQNCRVISMPSFELFDEQTKEYQAQTLGESRQFVSIEAQSSFGWHKYIGRDGIAIAIDQFGVSAPAKDLATQFGFTVPAILARLTPGVRT